jgi:hypothetical protein
MKKQTKKLALAKETLRSLEDLGGVAGGTTTISDLCTTGTETCATRRIGSCGTC